jgi:hypothetical protein
MGARLMPDAGISIIWGSVAAAAVTAIAAVGSAFISRSIKISEFRQGWIDALRDDIAEYISKADEWMDIYVDLNSTDNQNYKREKKPSLDNTRYKALALLRRIEMRLNLRESPHQALREELATLIDPGRIRPDITLTEPSRADWDEYARRAVRHAREILKREWDVAKHPLLSKICPFRFE